MSDPKIRKIAPSTADDGLPEPVKSSDKILPDEEGGKTGDKTVVIDNVGLTVPRTVGLLGATSFIVGTIIGAGIFISPKEVALGSGSVAFTLCSWVICGIVSMLAALCYAELGCVIKASGADYAYLDAAFGSILSFIFCWCYAILLKPATLATLALTFAEYTLTPFFEDGCGSAPDFIMKILAVAVLLLILAINVSSVKWTTRIQIIFTAAKLLALTIIIIGGIVKLGQGHTEYLRTGFNDTETNPGKVVIGYYGGMFAYSSWSAANLIAEEIIDPERNLPLSIIIALPLCIFIYLMTNISYFSVMSIKDMIDSEAVAITWAERVIPAASWLIPIFVAMSAFGAANGTLFTNARLLYVTGRSGHMPEILGMVNVDSYTLSPASIVLTILAIIFTIASNITILINFVSFLSWIFSGLGVITVIIFRYKAKYKNLPRPFKVPLIVPVFVLFCSIFLIVAPIVADPQLEFLYAAAFLAAGYMLFVPFIVFKLRLPFMKKVTMFFQLYLRVAKTKQSLD